MGIFDEDYQNDESNAIGIGPHETRKPALDTVLYLFRNTFELKRMNDRLDHKVSYTKSKQPSRQESSFVKVFEAAVRSSTVLNIM